MARKTYSSSVVAENDVCERVMALAHDVALTSMILSSWLAYSVLLEAHQSPLLHNLPCLGYVHMEIILAYLNLVNGRLRHSCLISHFTLKW